MQRLIEAAFRPPLGSGRSSGDGACGSRASSLSAPDGGGRRPGEEYAVLPRQTEDDIAFSEVHSKLDRALLFLQRELGYVLLDDAKTLGGGGVRLNAVSVLPSEAREARDAKGKWPKEEERYISDGELPQRSQEDQELPVVSPDAARYAHFPCDLVLVSRFVNVLSEVGLSAEQKKNHTLFKTVLQAIRLMHLCNYEYSDVVVTLTYASVYFWSTFKLVGDSMSDYEAAHVCVLLIYLAHSFVLDETCPLRCWQKHIFRKYCTLKVLDAAIFRLFELRAFVLRISQEDEKRVFNLLFRSGSGEGPVFLPCSPVAEMSTYASSNGSADAESTYASSSGMAAIEGLAQIEMTSGTQVNDSLSRDAPK